MTDFIWFLQAATDPGTNRGYTPGDFDGPDGEKVFNLMRSLSYRTEIGEKIDAADFPTEYQVRKTSPSRDLDLPMWYSGLIHVRDDVAEVMRRFDLGKTVLAPIRITLPDDGGVRTDFNILSVANLKPTIDPTLSVPLKLGRKTRGPLRADKVVDESVVALRSSMEGPDIWTDPQVVTTIFVSDQLARALLAEDFGKKLKLKKVRVAEPASGTEGDQA